MKSTNYFFDCDGVVLDSNKIKTNVFLEICNSISKEHSGEFIDFHKKNGGVSRYKKFEYLYYQLLNIKDEKLVKEASERFHQLVVEALIKAPYVEGVVDFIQSLRKGKNNRIFIVSGGDESELNSVFKERKFESAFDRICGSPRDKITIIKELNREYEMNGGVYFGDSTLDLETAKYFNHTFYFVNGYTELKNWKSWVEEEKVSTICDFSSAELRKINI